MYVPALIDRMSVCVCFVQPELKKVRSTVSGSGGSVHKELARTHQYTLQLERQLRYFLVKGAGECVCVRRESGGERELGEEGGRGRERQRKRGGGGGGEGEREERERVREGE